MRYFSTEIKDLWICQPDVFEDGRGHFYEAFNRADFHKNTGLDVDFVQQNQSKSAYGTLRGMHLQMGESSQAKLIRVIQGEVLDAVVDMRRDSPTFGKSYTVLLTAENRTQLFVPRYFAHGFLVLKPETVFVYSCDNYYNKSADITLNYKDPVAKIEWPEIEGDHILSEKDTLGLEFNAVIERMYA
ncbi:dTDP-4-dehydrorhamnose 3,5-epimerase [Flavimarina sp. Hel_I_48]|uniref:dTDP-4-dehydrorhamnose 3,5-epimerase n=1 Tax=Flavimarina sp. Hel_I_48 TaxID=1392488 RepID=UPI0004DEF4F5|nr:dTDP-4-dehydrorhamnose 3,5-epimerase [Flavimarina sp. Hel_I_48]